MKSLALLFLVVAFSVSISAQAPPPPPPAMIWSVPDKNEIKEFVESDYRFKVSYPGTPKKDVFVGEKVTQITYKVYRNGSNSTVNILVFPINMESQSVELYESYKDRLSELSAKGPVGIPVKKSEVTLDRQITVGGIKGREFGYLSDFHFTRAAVFVRGKYFFEVKTDVTNWHILTGHRPELSKSFIAEADRFIGSFSFIE